MMIWKYESIYLFIYHLFIYRLGNSVSLVFLASDSNSSSSFTSSLSTLHDPPPFSGLGTSAGGREIQLAVSSFNTHVSVYLE